MADVSISYKGNEIASMNATGVKTLLTSSAFCEDDITVTYTKPAAPPPTLQTKSATYTPTTSQQTDSITADAGYDGLDEVNVTVNAMPSGSATTPATTITANPSISVSSGGLITASVSGSQSVTPTVSAGYVSSGTAGTVSVSGSNTSQLTTQAAQTIHPSATDQSIASGKYLTGAQTVKGVLLTNLLADNIKKDVVVKVGDSTDDDCVTSVTGTYEGSGGGVVAAPMKDVNFIDYDGTIVYSFTAQEFSSLSVMPANPSHTGLVSQGWNWTLANAKTYVASYGKIWIGQMYGTESGDTEIDIQLHAPRLAPYLGIAINGTVEVDWGDGTAKSTVTGTSVSTQKRTLHNYSVEGNYTIKIHKVSGSYALYGTSTYGVLSGGFSTANNNKVYANAVKNVRINNSVTSIGTYTFNSCQSLSSVTIPNTVTSIGTYAFTSCYSLASVTIPNTVTSISNYTFNSCYSLSSVAMPNVTRMGTYAFTSCYSLASVTIPNVTSIGNNAFYYCYSLASVTIPNTVTSIGNNAFYSCYSLSSVTIPNSVTSIGTYAFTSCIGLGSIHFKSSTPPTVSNSNAWSGVPTDCIIYVPSGKLSDYKGASNYPSSSTYTYVEE